MNRIKEKSIEKRMIEGRMTSRKEGSREKGLENISNKLNKVKITEIEKEKISNNSRVPPTYLRILMKRIICAHWCKAIKAMTHTATSEKDDNIMK